MLSDRMQSLWDEFSVEEKQVIEARFNALRDEYMTLQAIRKHQKVTQKDMAELLGINQENVSRMERRRDMHLSTIKEYIEALGGEIEISAIFPGNKVVIDLNPKQSL